MVQGALDRQVLAPGGLVIESSSGNMALGLARACLLRDLRFVAVVDVKTSEVVRNMLLALGATLEVVTEPDPTTGEFLPARLRRVRELLSRLPGAIWLDQYSNLDNVRAHHATCDEILDELGRVDHLFVATSSYGTLRGCAERLRQRGLETQVIAVDSAGSVIHGGPLRPRRLPGHGSAVRPALYQDGLADRVMVVSEEESIAGCRLLASREGLLMGGSSGAVVAALLRSIGEFKDDAISALILCDRGERYLDTIYSDSWVASVSEAGFAGHPPSPNVASGA